MPRNFHAQSLQPWDGCDSDRLNNYGIFGGCDECGGTGQWECAHSARCELVAV